MVINLLACAGDDWVLSSGDDGVGKMGKAEKRKVVTVADVRKRYQDELDRRSVIEGERFEFGYGDGGDEMDIF